MKNDTVGVEFILLGLSNDPTIQVILFFIFMIGYMIILTGNILIIILIVRDTNLHTPMYFFISNLSFVDLCFSTSTIPRMLRDLVSVKKVISFTECATQLYTALSLGQTECILLTAMAYDRYIAIRYPLHYTTIINKMACFRIAAGTWICGFFFSIPQVTFTLNVNFCGNNVINDFLCEVPEMLALSCGNIFLIELIIYVAGVVLLIIPITFIFVSYVHIILSILQIASSAGRRKAFSTCGSHMIVVTMFYGSIIAAYMKPRSSLTPQRDKIITIFYCIVSPMLNPILYTLRNNDVKSAFLKCRHRYALCL